MCSIRCAEVGAVQVAQADGVRAADFVAVAGADAAPVVPMFSPLGVLLSSARSSAKCQGKITWARSLMHQVVGRPDAAVGEVVELLA